MSAVPKQPIHHQSNMCRPSYHTPIMQLRYRIEPMGTAEHQPRVGDKRSSAQPCSAETLTTIAHVKVARQGMRRSVNQ